MTISELGKKFKLMSRFQLKGYTHQGESSEDFILNFFLDYNQRYYTMDGEKAICGPKLARSIEDIYRITKFYYPNITLKIIMTHLAHWYTNKKINVLFCKAIKKRVFNIKYSVFNSLGEEGSNYYEHYKGQSTGSDEYGLTGDMYLNLLK